MSVLCLIANPAEKHKGPSAEEELAAAIKAKKGEVNYAVGPIVAKRAKIGFTTNGHTGEDVVLYSYDPRGRLLGGLVDNTQVGGFIARTLGVNLEAVTRRLPNRSASSVECRGSRLAMSR